MISPASVTTREGMPTTAIQNALNAPAMTPISSPMMTAISMGTPTSKSRASATAARPITEATERSISPLMMTKVMIRAIMIFSINSPNRLLWFLMLR